MFLDEQKEQVMERAAYHYGKIALADFELYLKELCEMAKKTLDQKETAV